MELACKIAKIKWQMEFKIWFLNLNQKIGLFVWAMVLNFQNVKCNLYTNGAEKTKNNTVINYLL